MSKESTPVLSEILLYRITHIENIPHILKYGITHRRSANANPDYKAIGDATLIDKRETKKVSINNEKIKTLGNFIPFYFGVRMPMLYVIQNGFNLTTAVHPEKSCTFSLNYKALSRKWKVKNIIFPMDTPRTT